jgi:hypothetical protein
MPASGSFYRLRPRYTGPGEYADWETCAHDLDSPVGQHNLRDDAFPDFEPEFQTVQLSRRSSLVDFVNATGVVGGSGLLVSEKALRVLEGMKLPPHQAYSLEVVHREKRVETPRYFWLQILLIDNYGWIDFGRSQFSVKHHLDMDETTGEPVEAKDERELKALIEARKSDHHFLATRLALNSAYARSPFDLFYFDWLGGLASLYPIVNGRLKAALADAGVAGHDLRAAPEIVL